MNLTDIQKCANFYKNNFIEQFYIITTYSESSFILVAEKKNFPHLMGIPKRKYISNGYGNAKKLYDDILNGVTVSRRIIPIDIVPNSKIYNKALNFEKAANVLLDNKCPVIIDYDPTKSTSKLDNVDKLIIDVTDGYMLGCKDNTQIVITEEIKLKKFCISSWMDENGHDVIQKEKYMPKQDVELVHTILAFDTSSNFVVQKDYQYPKETKKQILEAVSRNNSNLLINKNNKNNYVKIAKDFGIHCSINSVLY